MSEASDARLQDISARMADEIMMLHRMGSIGETIVALIIRNAILEDRVERQAELIKESQQ